MDKASGQIRVKSKAILHLLLKQCTKGELFYILRSSLENNCLILALLMLLYVHKYVIKNTISIMVLKRFTQL